MSTLTIVAELIREVMGEDGAVGEIGLDTSFSDDLELESIEFVALAEAVQQRFGDQVDFNGWLAGQSLSGLLTLKVGDLVRLIEDSRVSETP